MKKTVLVLIFTIASLLSGYSQTKKESIKELFVLMKLDSMMEKTMMTQPEIQKELMAVSLQKYTREMVKALVEMKQKTKP